MLAQLSHGRRQRIREVLVLADAEAVARHVHTAPEARVGGVESAKIRALGPRQKGRRARVAAIVERGADRSPVQPREPLRDRSAHAALAGLQTLHGR